MVNSDDSEEKKVDVNEKTMTLSSALCIHNSCLALKP